MKRWLLSILTLVLIGGLVVLAINYLPKKEEVPQPAPVEKVTLFNPTGPTVVPVAPLAAGKISGDLQVEVKYWKTNDEVIAALASDNADFAVLPVAAAANIQASDIPLTMLGVHEWKVFYMVAAADQAFDGFKSLAGKEVYIPVGKGTTIDVLLRSAISSEGLIPEQDVKIIYAPPQEITALFEAGKAVYAALPEPFVTITLAKGNGRIVTDFQEYYGGLVGTEPRIPIAGLFVKTAFLAEHPQEAQELVDQFKQSLTWYQDNVDQSLELSKEVLPIPAPIMKKSLERTSFYWVPTTQCRSEVENFLSKMQELYPEGIKKMPDKGFYAE